MSLSQFTMLNNDMMNKDTEMVPYQAPIIILDINSAVCMYNNGKYKKHQTHLQNNEISKIW